MTILTDFIKFYANIIINFAVTLSPIGKILIGIVIGCVVSVNQIKDIINKENK